jgi:hypothetical protein
MFPNVRSIIVAVFSSITALSFGFAVFAALRVNNEPLARLPATAPLQLVTDHWVPTSLMLVPGANSGAQVLSPQTQVVAVAGSDPTVKADGIRDPALQETIAATSAAAEPPPAAAGDSLHAPDFPAGVTQPAPQPQEVPTGPAAPEVSASTPGAAAEPPAPQPRDAAVPGGTAADDAAAPEFAATVTDGNGQNSGAAPTMPQQTPPDAGADSQTLESPDQAQSAAAMLETETEAQPARIALGHAAARRKSAAKQRHAAARRAAASRLRIAVAATRPTRGTYPQPAFATASRFPPLTQWNYSVPAQTAASALQPQRVVRRVRVTAKPATFTNNGAAGGSIPPQ